MAWRSRLRTYCIILVSALVAATPRCAAQSPGGGLSVVALGDAGEANGVLRGNAFYLTEMMMGRHDAGKPDLLLFLGDNFIPIGLNGAKNDVEGEVKARLGPFKDVLEALPRDRIHAIPGEHDYYSRYAVENTTFFGLFHSMEGPMGISDKGTRREAEIPSWTFHHHLTDELILPVTEGAADSVQFIFFDSALPLRTDPATWHPALEGLKRVLELSKGRQGILWRVLCVHHPLRSVGVHGGYSAWDDEAQRVEYLTECDKDTNAAGFVRNWLDPEDLCTEKYHQYIDSVTTIISAVGAKIHIALGAHDRSLQLLYAPESVPDCDACPRIHLISGAASLPTRVKLPAPPREFTSASSAPEKQGVSIPGFAQLQFDRERVRIVFISGRTGDPVDMGNGQTAFWVDRKGNLVDLPSSH